MATLLFPVLAAAADAPALLNNRLSALAGAAAVDCGTLALRDDRKAAIACATRNDVSAKPFRLAVQLPSADSVSWQGAARDANGKLWALFYEADPSGANPTFSSVLCLSLKFDPGDDPIECRPDAGSP